MTWPTKKLEEVLALSDNGIWGPEDLENGIPILRSTNFNNDGSVNFEDIAHRQVKGDSLKEKQLQKGDILLERSGGGPKQPVGRVVYFDKEGEYYFGNFLTRLRPIREVYPKFLFHFLFNIYQKGITNTLQKQTTGIRNLRFKEYLNFEIPLPPLKIQKQVVVKVEELFEKIDKAKELREKAQEETEQIFSSALQEVFSKAEKKWEARKLSDPTIAEVTMGQSPPSSTYNNQGNGLPFYQGKVDFSEIYLKPPQKWCSKPTKVALKNDVLISVRAPVGPTNICKEKSCIGRGLAAIRAKENLDNFYLFYWFRYNEPEIVNFGQGSTFGAIKKDYLENFKIPLPLLSEQKKIVAYLDNLREKVEKLKQIQQKQLEELTELKQSILAKAFKGGL